MSLTSAQAAANQLRTALLDNGVRAVSIELQTGRVDSGWGVAPFKRGLGHHIVSRPPGTPGLALVKRGRADLPGPLCNGYGGYDLVARIICLGWANHPGAGGPWSVPGWGTVPEDQGRPYIFGWEFEGGIDPWTDEMHDFMARCGAGTLDWLGTLPGNPGPAPLECWGEHFTWAGPRKVDRLNYTTQSGRDRIAAVRRKPAPGGFLMALSDAEQHEHLELMRGLARYIGTQQKPGNLAQIIGQGPARAKSYTVTALTPLLAAVAAAADVNEEQLAAALVPSLVPAVIEKLGDEAGITEAQVEAALRRVFADAAQD